MAIVNSRLSDLSVTGAFVESLSELPVGTHLMLRFQASARQIDVAAQVVHAMPQFGMGVRFVSLTPENRAEIEQLVRDNA